MKILPHLNRAEDPGLIALLRKEKSLAQNTKPQEEPHLLRTIFHLILPIVVSVNVVNTASTPDWLPLHPWIVNNAVPLALQL